MQKIEFNILKVSMTNTQYVISSAASRTSVNNNKTIKKKINCNRSQ